MGQHLSSWWHDLFASESISILSNVMNWSIDPHWSAASWSSPLSLHLDRLAIFDRHICIHFVCSLVWIGHNQHQQPYLNTIDIHVQVLLPHPNPLALQATTKKTIHWIDDSNSIVSRSVSRPIFCPVRYSCQICNVFSVILWWIFHRPKTAFPCLIECSIHVKSHLH